MIDTHVHFNINPLLQDIPGIINRCEAVGVVQFVVIGFDVASSEKAVAQAHKFASCFAVVGVHPHDANNWNEETAARIHDLAQNKRVVAVGEIGLDFYTGVNNERTLAPRETQAEVFRAQLHLAQTLNLPVVIHCREAYEETLRILEAEAGDTPVLLHCFAGNTDEAKRAFARGWYIGVGGTLTYKKNNELRTLVRDCPQPLLLLETDAPYLSPEPLRGKFPNDPSRLPLVAQKLAELRGETLEQVETYTTANAHRLFPKLKAFALTPQPPLP